MTIAIEGWLSKMKALDHHVRACRCGSSVASPWIGAAPERFDLKQLMLALLYQKTSQFPSKVYEQSVHALKEPTFLR
jgi:hypothetical protein